MAGQQESSSFDALRRTVTTNHGEIAYAETGDGPPALFIHGLLLNSYLWRHVMKELAGDRRCIAVDLMGHGESPVEPGTDLSLAGQGEMVESFCEAMGLGAVDLVGNDSGGAIAQILAARHPERLRTLTLTNCDTKDCAPPPDFQAAVDLAATGELAPVIAQMVTEPDLARSPLGLGSGYERPEAISDETVHAYLGRFADPEAGRALERFITSPMAQDLQAVDGDLSRLEVPTLIVWGTADNFFEVSWAHVLRDLIPGAKDVVELEGAKLFFPDERAAELALHLRAFWAAQPASLATGPGAAILPGR